MGAAKQDLLARAIDEVAAHGIGDVSLRELAASLGTSHRMLLYHFGSREGLVAAIVESVEAAQRDALAQLAGGATTARALIEAQWDQLSDPAMRPFVVLFFELTAMALHGRPGTEGFLDGLTEPWLDLATDIAHGLGDRADRDLLRLGVAVTRGLLLDAATTGDVAAATRSLHAYLDLWDAAAPDR